MTVQLDVTSDKSVTDAVRLVQEHTDRLDVLIDNAGAPGKGVAPADGIHSVHDTDVYGPIRVTHAFLPLPQAADPPIAHSPRPT
ncbi:SDR family oxidoreductase [Nonomuraea terrae]|uniref:SDR family oxidoreductase n=1 Tax=Nonomuraea terrae TaxID=2530383 RepID=UPI0037B928A2